MPQALLFAHAEHTEPPATPSLIHLHLIQSHTWVSYASLPHPAPSRRQRPRHGPCLSWCCGQPAPAGQQDPSAWFAFSLLVLPWKEVNALDSVLPNFYAPLVLS